MVRLQSKLFLTLQPLSTETERNDTWQILCLLVVLFEGASIRLCISHSRAVGREEGGDVRICSSAVPPSIDLVFKPRDRSKDSTNDHFCGMKVSYNATIADT